jgi:hypothetical protein
MNNLCPPILDALNGNANLACPSHVDHSNIGGFKFLRFFFYGGCLICRIKSMFLFHISNSLYSTTFILPSPTTNTCLYMDI